MLAWLGGRGGRVGQLVIWTSAWSLSWLPGGAPSVPRAIRRGLYGVCRGHHRTGYSLRCRENCCVIRVKSSAGSVHVWTDELMGAV